MSPLGRFLAWIFYDQREDAYTLRLAAYETALKAAADRHPNV